MFLQERRKTNPAAGSDPASYFAARHLWGPNLLSSQKTTKSAGKLNMTGLLLRGQNRTTSLPALRLPLSLTKPAKNSTNQPNESVKSIKSNSFPIILPLILQKWRWIPIMKTCGTLYYPSTELCVRLEPLIRSSSNTVERLRECHQLQPITLLRVAIIDYILTTSPQC